MADLLEVRNLRTYLQTSHSVAQGRTVALVGESWIVIPYLSCPKIPYLSCPDGGVVRDGKDS